MGNGSDDIDRISELAARASRLAAVEREGFLDRECGVGTPLRRAVERLLFHGIETEDAAAESKGMLPDVHWPEAIGRYRILGLLGEGGMGVVYRGQQDAPRRVVALKVIRPGFVRRSSLQRFRFEAEVLGRLDHPSIAHIYEAGTADAGSGPQPFFAMELIEGRPLTQFAAEEKLSVQARLELMIKICGAIQHAHQKGVIHRDLKPSNILVTKDGEPKVLDFGVARVIDSGSQGEEQAVTMHTQAGQVIGTPQYMSPEQALGEVEKIDTQSDVYSLGVIAYELLSGRRPHELLGKSALEAACIIRDQTPARLSTENRLLAGDIETIVFKALAKEKSRRYATAADLAAEIRRYLNHEPIMARPVSSWYYLSRFARRNRAAMTGAVAAVVCLIAGTIVSNVMAVRATHASQEAEHQRILASNAEIAARAAQAKAERRLREQQQLVTRVMFDVNDSIERLPGAAKARILLVRSTADALTQLAADVTQDVSVQKDLSMALLKVGDVQQQLDQLADALPSHRKALEIRQRISRQSPTDGAALWDVIISLQRVAALEKITGEGEQSLADYRELRQASTRMIQSAEFGRIPGDQQAMVYRMLGEVETVEGRPAEALAAYETAVRLSADAFAQKPQSRSVRSSLMVSRQHLGDVKAKLQRREEALEEYRGAELLAEDFARDPTDTWAARDLANLRAKVKEVSEPLKNSPALLLAAQSRLDQARARFKAAPEDADGQILFSDCLKEIADLEDAGGQNEKAVAHFEEMVQVEQQSGKALSQARRIRLLGVCIKLAIKKRQTRDVQGALHYGSQALEIATELADSRPTDVALRRQVGIAQDSVANDQETLDMASEWQPAYRRAIEVRTQVLDSALAEPRDAGFLRESCKRMAAAQLKRGQREDARETLAKAASAFDRLVAAHPDLHTAMGCSLVCARAAIQGASADHLAKQGDKGGAIAEYRGAIERLTEAHRIRPNEPELLDLLADLHSQLGFLVLGQRLNDQALAHFRESARMEVLLQETNPPGLSLHQHRLRIILRMESEAAAAFGQVEAALAPVQQSIALDQRLLAANPKDTTARIDLSGDWARAADLFLALRRYSEAISAFDHVVLMQQGKDGASALNVEDGAKDDRLFCLAAAKFCKGIWSAGSDSKVDTEQRRVLLGKVIEYARAFDMASLRLKKNGALSAELEKASREVAESVAGAQSALAR